MYVKHIYLCQSIKWAILELLCAYVSKQVHIQNLSYENEFNLHENELEDWRHFHMLNGFAKK